MQKSRVFCDAVANDLGQVHGREPSRLHARTRSPMAAFEEVAAEIVGSRRRAVETSEQLVGSDGIASLASDACELGECFHRSEGAPNVVDQAVHKGLEPYGVGRVAD